MEDTLGQIEESKKLLGKTKQLSEWELHAADDDDYLQTLFSTYAVNGKDGIKMISKDKAYKAASECIKKWKGLSQTETLTYLKDNFDTNWAEHDPTGKNKIDITEAYQLMKQLWAEFVSIFI